MALKGRPRLTPEDYEARLEAYCAKFSVEPTPEGIPPFPSGRRETAQHRAWLSLYKAHSRLQRHEQGAAAIDAAEHHRCPLCASSLDKAAPDVLQRVQAYLTEASTTPASRRPKSPRRQD